MFSIYCNLARCTCSHTQTHIKLRQASRSTKPPKKKLFCLVCLTVLHKGEKGEQLLHYRPISSGCRGRQTHEWYHQMPAFHQQCLQLLFEICTHGYGAFWMPGVVFFVQMKKLSDDGDDDEDNEVLMMVAAGHCLSVWVSTCHHKFWGHDVDETILHGEGVFCRLVLQQEVKSGRLTIGSNKQSEQKGLWRNSSVVNMERNVAILTTHLLKKACARSAC